MFFPIATTTLVTITVKDVNDNKPVFQNTPYKYSVNEENQSGFKIGEFFAIDLDTGKNAELTYSIMSGAEFNGQKM